MASSRRRSIRISALSTIVGSVVDYLGFDGYGELGLDSAEYALESAYTSMGGSRRENYPILIQGGSEYL